jgi:hypothetical protein
MEARPVVTTLRITPAHVAAALIVTWLLFAAAGYNEGDSPVLGPVLITLGAFASIYYAHAMLTTAAAEKEKEKEKEK